MVSDDMWALLKVAAQEYSTYRPRLVTETFSLAIDELTVTPSVPQVMSVEFCSYGEQLTQAELATAPEGTQGWFYTPGLLSFSEMTEATDVVVIWRAMHQPDELTRSFPTIPAQDQLLLIWLADAEEADLAQAASELGVAEYTIGNTSVKYATQNRSMEVGTRSTRLRARALAALQQPIATFA